MSGRLLAFLALLALAAAAGVSGAAPPGAPPPLGGVPLSGATGLRLLIPNVPPVLLDVDTGRLTRIRGIQVHGDAVARAVAVGPDAVVAVNREIYAVRRGATSATRIGTGWEVAPAAGGRAVWVKSRDRRHCVLRRIRLDGRVTRSARRMTCAARLIDAGGRSVIAHRGTISDPLTGQALLRAAGVWAIANNVALGDADGYSRRPLPLTDLRTREVRLLPWPSTIDLTDEAVVHPNGRLLAVGFGEFVPRVGTSQVTDVWLLDSATGEFQHLPDMPAAADLKRTSMSWTSDGRLVWLADTAGRHVVAVWSPGEDRIRARAVRLLRSGGSDSFVVWAR